MTERVVPALPLLVAVFANTPAHVQLVVSLYLAGIGAGQLVYGPVSDRFGRRPVLLASLAAFLAGTAQCQDPGQRCSSWVSERSSKPVKCVGRAAKSQ